MSLEDPHIEEVLLLTSLIATDSQLSWKAAEEACDGTGRNAARRKVIRGGEWCHGGDFERCILIRRYGALWRRVRDFGLTWRKRRADDGAEGRESGGCERDRRQGHGKCIVGRHLVEISVTLVPSAYLQEGSELLIGNDCDLKKPQSIEEGRGRESR